MQNSYMLCQKHTTSKQSLHVKQTLLIVSHKQDEMAIKRVTSLTKEGW